MARRPTARRRPDPEITRIAEANAALEERAEFLKSLVAGKVAFGHRETDPEYLALLRADVRSVGRRLERIEAALGLSTPRRKGRMLAIVPLLQEVVRTGAKIPDATVIDFSKRIIAYDERDWVELVLGYCDQTPWVAPLRVLIESRHLESPDVERAEAHLRAVAKNVLEIQGFGDIDPDEFLGRGNATEEVARSMVETR